MKILLTSSGTRGDVQPYLALAVGLQKAGHHATLATSYNYTDWIESYGVHARPTNFSMQEELKTAEAQAIIKSKNYIRQIGLLREFFRKSGEAQDEVWPAIEDADFVIQSPAASGVLEAASTHGIPGAFAVPGPFAPTRAFPSFFMGARRSSLGAGYNRLTHQLMHKMLWSAMGAPVTNPLRKKLGLRPFNSFGKLLAHSNRAGVPWLNGFSTHVVPQPKDWDEHQHITGYWFLDAQPDWQPPEDLLQFLESGPPPVYIGFGSMSDEDPERQTEIALRALELCGQRGVLATGWGGLTRRDMNADVFFVDDVPHGWLFPRMAAVVHHGGAGTTGAGLRAGVPNIILPLAPNDQWAWAERVAKLGVGLQLPGIKKLAPEKLAGGINSAISAPSIRARAAALGEKIRAEDGVGRAVEIIERHAAGYRKDQHVQ